MPVTTYELRWFIREKPFLIDKVFGVGSEPDERVDWYAPPAHKGTGTKLREGRLETKLRTDSVEEVHVAGCHGTMERWQKWSASLAESMPDDALLAANGWIAVRKRRWLQIWSTEAAELAIVDGRAGQGALFELTELEVSSVTSWTVGFEAFGPEGTRQSSLERVMTHVLEHLPAHGRLASSDSMGYPAWLLRA
ncbi:MAG: hypothetical protein OXT73_02575 [Bacteroidota bacterium]|nr:hypothetical protein [Bacteroidota bacterium]